MSETVIRVENLSKKYILRHQESNRSDTLRDAIAKGASGLFKPKGKPQPQSRKILGMEVIALELEALHFRQVAKFCVKRIGQPAINLF